MKPSNEEIIEKYKKQTLELQDELQEVQGFLNTRVSGDYPELYPQEFSMMRKGYTNRKVEIETHLNKIKLNIGKLILKD